MKTFINDLILSTLNCIILCTDSELNVGQFACLSYYHFRFAALDVLNKVAEFFAAEIVTSSNFWKFYNPDVISCVDDEAKTILRK